MDGEIEKIVMGAGIGFQKRRNDIVPKSQIEKIFVMEEESERFQELLKTLPVAHIEMAEEIISYAERELCVPLSNHVHIALTDHLSFAIERLQKGIDIENKLLNEIKIFYKKEFEIGLWAKALLKERLGIEIPEDEVGHIALHIHNAKEHTSMEHTVRHATMIQEMIQIIANELKKDITQDSLSYQRLLTHLRFTIKSLEDQEPLHLMDTEMLHMIKTKYHQSFQIAVEMNRYVQQEYGIDFPESELGYVTLYIQRIYEQ